MGRHPTLGAIGVPVANLKAVAFQPTVNVNYAETAVPMRDELPKFRGFSAEFGGTGELIPEWIKFQL